MDILPTCPICDGEGVLLGHLGHTPHLRCRECGSDFRGVRREPAEPREEYSPVVKALRGFSQKSITEQLQLL